jgi:hypothetical protein
MLDTNTWMPRRSGSRVAMVAWNCCWKVAGEVMVATDEVQRSLAD